MSDQIRPDATGMREVLLKLEVNQHVRTEMYLAKEDLREYLRRDSERIRTEIIAERQKLFTALSLLVTVVIGGDIWAFVSMKDRVQTALNEEVASIRGSVKQRLDEEFRTPRITALVEEKAREYTKNEAQRYITEQVESGLKPYQKRVNAAFGELGTQKSELAKYQSAAQQAAENLNHQQMVSALFGGALSGSRRDFEELNRLGKENPSLSGSTRKALDAVSRSLEQFRKPMMVSGGIEISMQDQQGHERNLQTFSSAELFKALQSQAEGSEMMRYVMGYLISKPRGELVAPALEILRSSQSLPGLASTTGVLLNVYGAKAAFIDIDGWMKFLTQEQAKYAETLGKPTRK
jgi:hypothetical protein